MLDVASASAEVMNSLDDAFVGTLKKAQTDMRPRMLHSSKGKVGSSGAGMGDAGDAGGGGSAQPEHQFHH